jgi:hypothetical protein
MPSVSLEAVLRLFVRSLNKRSTVFVSLSLREPNLQNVERIHQLGRSVTLQNGGDASETRRSEYPRGRVHRRT